MQDEIKILTPVGMLGYGFSLELFWSAVHNGVDAIVADSGSTDTYEKDLEPMVAACHYYKVPILIGSAGGDGANSRLPLFLEIISEIIAKNGYRPMKVLTIEAEIDKELVYAGLERGVIRPCGGAVPPLQKEDVDAASRLVAQMGHEPYVKAMQDHPDFDIIIGGRSYDPAPYAAFCIHKGIKDLGIAYHMGKIMECGALCATPKSREAMAVVRQGSFDLWPLATRGERCTKVSVAGQDACDAVAPLPPDAIHNQVGGAPRFRVSKTSFIGGRQRPNPDPRKLTTFLDKGRAMLTHAVRLPLRPQVPVYGRTDGAPFAKEIGVSGVVWADTQERANHVASLARVYLCTRPAWPAVRVLRLPPPPRRRPDLVVPPIKAQTLDGPDTAGSTSPALTNSFKDGSGLKPPEGGDQSRADAVVKAAPAMPAAETWPRLPRVAGAHCAQQKLGPYEITMDVMLPTQEAYDRVQKAGVLTREKVIEMYGVRDEDVLPSGSFGEVDMYACQMHVPLLYLEVPEGDKET
ncbi:hypothetical protein B0H14DRAFT_3904864 [Mycena olivaceomarginata]|nr:hypothetical protein B0H14DRAFT_3904864 [Mycena olivaceomarginata]